jgi:hypothetical protein
MPVREYEARVEWFTVYVLVEPLVSSNFSICYYQGLQKGRNKQKQVMEDCLQQKYAKMTIIQNHHRTTNRGTDKQRMIQQESAKH